MVAKSKKGTEFRAGQLSAAHGRTLAGLPEAAASKRGNLAQRNRRHDATLRALLRALPVRRDLELEVKDRAELVRAIVDGAVSSLAPRWSEPDQRAHDLLHEAGFDVVWEDEVPEHLDDADDLDDDAGEE